MAELRFQCFEVDNMQRTRQGLLEENTLLLGRAASARHAVQETARRSHLLQRIIRYMHKKVKKIMKLPSVPESPSSTQTQIAVSPTCIRRQDRLF